MGAPQKRRLIRARGLASFRRALADLAVGDGPLSARRRLVVIPTRAAAELLRQTIEGEMVASGVAAIVLPDFVTREEWLRRLHLALPGAPPLLTRVEREVLFSRAAREAQVLHGRSGALHMRPGLVSAMLAFYDELQRRQRTVRRFARGLFDELRVERGTDRGSEHLIDQTRFLAFTFLAYARGVAASGGLDEHALRVALVTEQPTLPFDDLVVAVADHPADPQGLWPADFDLIGRLAHLAQVHVVVTDEAHDAGLRERLERELPGIEESRVADVAWSPVLVTPENAAASPAFISRDREEEVRDVARTIRDRANRDGSGGPSSVAVVFHRPLPYLYLAQQVLGDARIPYQAFDALPLAAEPYAALLDLVLTVARTGGTREAVIALLRSSLLEFVADGRAITRDEVSTLETVLLDRRASGDAMGFGREVDAFFGNRPSRHELVAESARRAAAAAAAVAAALAAYRTAATASAQVGTLAAVLRGHERPVPREDDRADRHHRARAAVLGVLDSLAEAFGRHDDQQRDEGELTAAIHHAIEAQTFMPRRGHAGVHLVEAVAARFGEFDDVYLVGLAETDWTNRHRRNIFYSTGLLKSLGWPQDADQTVADEAAFRDCLTLARSRTRLSSFELDGDTIVGRSSMIELARGMPSESQLPARPSRIFADERLTLGVVPEGLDAGQAGWLRVRHARPALDTPLYAGQVSSRPATSYRVSAIDRYVACPFKYYAEHVLGLREELADSSGLTPIERGTLLHTLFEQFYREWQRQGERAITKANLPRALGVFSTVVDAALAALPEADRALEYMRVMGSIVGRGVAERVFEIEIADGLDVRERFLEEALNGAFQFPDPDGAPTSIAIRGKADRIDVLADGSIRVVDYKLGRMPDLDTSVQVAVYAHCARQVLEARDREPRPVAAAMYLAFGDDKRLEGRMQAEPGSEVDVIESRAGEFARTIRRIEAGEFPPRPLRVGDCQWCGFATVCRKEYRVEDDEPADAL